MNRRDFLKRAAAGSAGLVLTPHAALHNVQSVPAVVGGWGLEIVEETIEFVWALKRMHLLEETR